MIRGDLRDPSYHPLSTTGTDIISPNVFFVYIVMSTLFVTFPFQVPRYSYSPRLVRSTPVPSLLVPVEGTNCWSVSSLRTHPQVIYFLPYLTTFTSLIVHVSGGPSSLVPGRTPTSPPYLLTCVLLHPGPRWNF